MCHLIDLLQIQAQSMLALQLLQAFNLSQIAQQAYLIQKEEKDKKREAAERLTVPYVLSERGFTLAELFGYHFSKVLHGQFAEIARKKKLVRVNYEQFSALMNELWINMNQYKLFLPILFSILKGCNNSVAIRDIDMYLQICRQQINPFMAQLKQQIPPSKIKEMASAIEVVCEREDLKGQGFVQKIIIADLIKKYLNQSKESINIDERLVVNDEVNYKMLLSDKYFGSGIKIRQFLSGKLADKIKKCIKKVGMQRKKFSRKKKQTKRLEKSPVKKKQTKQEKLIKEYMQQNKKQIKQDRKKLETIAKSILYQCIKDASDFSEVESVQKPQFKVKKSIYTSEPIIIEHELKCYPAQILKVFPIQYDSGLFITEGQGKIINLLDGSIRSTFKLNPSLTLNHSPICDYAYENNILYVIREDGLLFSWSNEAYSFNKMIQTQFRFKSKPLQQFNSKYALFVNQGIIMINCQETNNSFELYSLDLSYIGNIFVNKQEFGLSHAILKESRELANILKSLKRDYIIKSKAEYEGLIRSSYEFKEYELGNYLFNRFETISACKVGDFADWVLSHKARNPLLLDKSMILRLRNKRPTKQDFSYLQNYHYINQATSNAIETFLRSHEIVQIDHLQRRAHLITLLEDNPFKQIQETSFLARHELLECIEKCGLTAEQQRILFNGLSYNSKGDICVHQLMHGEQYLRILSFRHNRFFSRQNYEKNELPPIIFNSILPFPLLDFYLASVKFPNFSIVYVLSFHSVIINKLNLSDYVQNAKVDRPPTFSFCQMSGYLAVCFNNTIIIWNINHLRETSPSPTKIVKGLEKESIIGLDFMYFSNTMVTVTQQQVKIWDLQEVLFSNTSSDIVFKIKPGFKAIQRQAESGKWEPKKKILIRGQSQSFFTANTKSNNYILGVVSKGERPTDAYLKLCYICKFSIMIGSSRQFDQVPTKILRQLDAEARRMKFTERVIEKICYTVSEIKMIDCMVSDYQHKLNEQKLENSKELSIALINKISNLHSMLTQYPKFISNSLLKSQLHMEDMKVFKFNLMLKIHLCQTEDDLKSIFTQQFIALYHSKQRFDKNLIMEDIFEWQDRAYLSKFLCILSQIYKYSLPYKCSYVELIYNQKQDKLDEKLIETLLSNSQISKNIIKTIVSLANQIKIDSVKAIIVKIIDKFLPTQYRFPSLRYYKNINKHSAEAPFDYFINRFDQFNRIGMSEVVLSPKKYSNILEHIQNQNFTEKVQELSKVYPQIIRDNLQLIDICMCFNLITQQEATFYILAPTNSTLISLMSDSAPKRIMQDLDNLIGSIVYVLTQQKLRIPKPHFTYQWFYDHFKNAIDNDDKLYDIFYNELRGSLTQHVAYSSQLQFYIDLNKKSIAINYNPMNWKQLLGTRIYPLLQHQSKLKDSFYQQKFIDCHSFEKQISVYIPKQAQTITIRSCAASKNHESHISNFNEEKSLKTYKDEYINLDHLFYYLEESKKERQSETLSTFTLIKKVSAFDIRIPTANLVAQLTKCSGFLTRTQVVQIISESVTSFTYGSMLEWVNSLPFVRMRGKTGKETRVCAVWELKKYLKFDWQNFGWILLNKYGKANILNKCIIVEGTVDGKQLSQVFNSEAIFKLFVASNPELKDFEITYSLELLEKLVEKYMVNPAMQSLKLVFKAQTINHISHISDVLLSLANKNDEIQLEKFVKYFLTNSDTKEATVKLVLVSIFGKAKKIKIKESLAKLSTLFKALPNHSQNLIKWIGRHENQQKSLLQRIIPMIQPHQVIKRKENVAESLIIANEHISHIIEKDEKWVYSYDPSLTLSQFLDYIHSFNSNENLESLINNCVLKHGIHSIFNSIEQGSFPQFYAKCRSVSKSLSKLTVIQFSKIYETLSDAEGRLSMQKLFKVTQSEILPEEKITWIIEYLQNSGKQNFTLENLRICNLIMNINEPVSELKSLTDSLRYEQYLVKRYIKSANKLAFIIKQLDDSLMTYQMLSELKLSHDQISILTKYLKANGDEILSKLRESENKATTEVSEVQERQLLEQIADYMRFFNERLNSTQQNLEFNVNVGIIQKQLKQTMLFSKMNQQISPEWSCLLSYINLYHYCRHLLINTIFRKYTYRQMILDELKRSLLGVNLTFKNLYEIFGLAYLDNFVKYMPYFLPPNSAHHAIEPKLFNFFRKQLIEAFVKFDGVIQIKYPLNFSTFKQILGENETKTQQKSVDYGQIYKRLNIWGCGYVNLNDISQYRSKRLAYPYIQINSFISQAFPKVKKWRKINPPGPVFQNREKICNELIKLEEQSQLKCKMIRQDNLWRVLGFYLTKQHRLYIDHGFQSKGRKDFYNIVDIIEWINTNSDENEPQNAEILLKLIAKIEESGGVYNIIRKYHREIILSQSADTFKQQNAYLLLFIEQSNQLQSTLIKQFVKQLLNKNKIEQFLDTDHTIENGPWLQQTLTIIVDTYNKQVRQWSNYNNSLVKFLNQLPENQFLLIKSLYQANHTYNSHKLFDILANGAQYFTFTSFWVYNINSDEAYPFSKEEVNEVYKIIDVNSDGNISYQQFCRFWSAVQQIYSEPLPSISNQMSKIKENVFQTFLDSIQPHFQKEVDKQIDKISIQMLESLTNIKHKQKLQRLIKILAPEDSFGLSVDVHKLKVLLKQHKLKKHRKMHENLTYSNYFAKLFGPEIEDFCKSKENLQNTLNRWLFFTYPHFGCYLAQLFYEFGWSKEKIITWINQYKIISQPAKSFIKLNQKSKQNPAISLKNQHLFGQLAEVPHKFELFYKKFIHKRYEPKEYGKSISYKLYLNDTLQQFSILVRQIDQISYFLEQIQSDENKLIYNLDERQGQGYDTIYNLENSSALIPKVIKESKLKFEFVESVTIKDNIFLQFYANSQFAKQEIEIINKQLRGKSNNRMSLVSNKKLYSDPKISNSYFDQQQSNMNKIFTITDYTLYKPLIKVEIIKNGKFTSIESMIKLIDLAVYIYKQHNIIGLFVNLENICIDYDGEKQFKISQFYNGIKLDADGNYFEGVNPKDISNDVQSIYPPQVYENIFTQTFDSYCLAHILYYLFTGEVIASKSFAPSPEESNWFNYSELQYKARRHISFLSLEEKSLDIQSQIVFFTLLKQCTEFEWHMRPKVYQIAETLRNILQMNSNNLENIGKQLIVKAPISQYCLTAARQANIANFTEFIKASSEYEWNLAEIEQLRESLPDDPKFYYAYNELLQDCLSRLEEASEIGQFGAFMNNVVEYLCQSDKKQTTFLALQTYKDIVASPIIKRYFDFCDEQWKINEWNIHEKLKQLNMKNRIRNLPKSSQYYFDLSTLIETKMTLFMGQASEKNKKHDSTKKIAMTFIQSSLLSHNVNKLSALQKSGVLLNLFKYIEDPEFEETVLKIYLLATSCLNPNEVVPTHRAMEEGYKVMMVMHNIINLQRGVKKGETVVDMLTFMNNYYNFYGEECKSDVLRDLCRSQICNLPTFTFLFNIKVQNVDLRLKILLNLTYEQAYYKLLKGVTVNAYESYKKNQKLQETQAKIQQLLKNYEKKISLNELSIESHELESRQYYTSKENISALFLSYQSLIDKHSLFFQKKNSKLTKGEHYRYENNFYEHFGKFLQQLRKIAKDQLQNSYFNADSCNLIKSIFELHYNLLQIWSMQEETIKYMIDYTENIYEKEFLYSQNLLLNSIQDIVFKLLIELVKKSFKIMIKLGFIHFFFRIMKKQHEFLDRYIKKGVQNIQLKGTYSQEAEFRLNMIDLLLEGNSEEVHRIFIIIGFPKYLIDNMLASPLLLDLRYYKASFDIVPFRYCSPLRSQAITMLSFILPIQSSILRSEVISRLISVIAIQKERLQIPTETPESKMRFVEALWLFGNIIQCEDERLKYEFVNNGSYQILIKLLEKCELLNQFFPKMSQTMKTGNILKSSILFTRMLPK